MDSGEVIPGLNEGWTLAGAKFMEWIAGLLSTLIVGSLFGLNPTTWMPLYIIVCLGTVYFLAGLRSQHPDEERGIANLVATKLGFAPPGIPRPARIQPIWSGAPIKELAETTDYSYLDLNEVFDLIESEKRDRK